MFSIFSGHSQNRLTADLNEKRQTLFLQSYHSDKELAQTQAVMDMYGTVMSIGGGLAIGYALSKKRTLSDVGKNLAMTDQLALDGVLKDWSSNPLSAVGDVIKHQIDKVVSPIKNITKWVTDGVKKLVTNVKKIGSEISNIWKKAKSGDGDSISRAQASLTKKAKPYVQAVRNFFKPKIASNKFTSRISGSPKLKTSTKINHANKSASIGKKVATTSQRVHQASKKNGQVLHQTKQSVKKITRNAVQAVKRQVTKVVPRPVKQMVKRSSQPIKRVIQKLTRPARNVSRPKKAKGKR